MQTVQAIETRYRGYRFRSRLEARWAVFMDALGVRYEYEPEGFVLPDGGAYLPDFALPELGHWLEVKPPLRDMETDAIWDMVRKARGLADLSRKGVAVLYGYPPEPADIRNGSSLDVDTLPSCEIFGRPGPTQQVWWGFCPACDRTDLCRRKDCGKLWCPRCGAQAQPFTDAIVGAYHRARGYRFDRRAA